MTKIKEIWEKKNVSHPYTCKYEYKYEYEYDYDYMSISINMNMKRERKGRRYREYRKRMEVKSFAH